MVEYTEVPTLPDRGRRVFRHSVQHGRPGRDRTVLQALAGIHVWLGQIIKATRRGMSELA